MITFVKDQMTTLGDGVKITVEEEQCSKTEVDQQLQEVDCDCDEHDVPDDVIERVVEDDDGNDDGCCHQ